MDVGEPSVRLDPTYFNFHYDNLLRAKDRNAAYLCYVVESRRGREALHSDFRHLCNQRGGDHVERLVLRRLRRRLLLLDVNYSIRWFCSWSPCAGCSQRLVQFVSETPNLRLHICVSRLYCCHGQANREGLRELERAGVQISAMKYQDFEYCWQNFVNHGERGFEAWDDLEQNSDHVEMELHQILQEDLTAAFSLLGFL